MSNGNHYRLDAGILEALKHETAFDCRDDCPEWFDAPDWRDWHRGHGCNKDDGKPRSERGAECINRRRGLIK